MSDPKPRPMETMIDDIRKEDPGFYRHLNDLDRPFRRAVTRAVEKAARKNKPEPKAEE